MEGWTEAERETEGERKKERHGERGRREGQKKTERNGGRRLLGSAGDRLRGSLRDLGVRRSDMSKRKDRSSSTREDGLERIRKKNGFRASERRPEFSSERTVENEEFRHPEKEKAKKRIRIKRTRQVDWIPGSVSSISASPDSRHLAVAREASGSEGSRSIEVWETEHWTRVAVMKAPFVDEEKTKDTQNGEHGVGSGHCEVTGIAWLPEPGGSSDRIVTSGLDGMLVEWDIKGRGVVQTTEVGGGAIWGLAVTQAGSVQGAGGSDANILIACACDDGRLRIYSYVNGGLQFEKVIGRAEGRALSAAWQDNASGIAVGTSDGFIRLWKMDSMLGKESICISLGDCCIWSLLVLKDGTIISGDSKGTTSFWDGQHGTLLHEFAQHEADVMCTAASPSGMVVFSSGSDSKICSFESINNEDGIVEWVYTGYKRAHTHDVQSLGIVTGSTFDGGALISGGNDAQLYAYSAESFSSFHPVRFCRSPQVPHITLCPGTGSEKPLILAVQRNLSIELLRVSGCSSADQLPTRSMGKLPMPSLPVGKIENDSKNPIFCSAFAGCGNFLAFTDVCSTKVLELRWNGTKFDSYVAVGTFPTGRSICLSPNGDILFLCSHNGSIFAYDIPSGKLLHSFDDHLGVLSLESHFEDECLHVSPNGKWLIASFAGKKEIHVFNANAMKYHGSLSIPSDIAAPITAVAFDEEGDHVGLCTAVDVFCFFELNERKLDPWSIRNSAAITQRLEKVPGYVQNISFCHTPNCQLALLATPSSLCIFDMGQAVSDMDHTAGRKRRISGGSILEDKGFKVVELVEPCLFVSFARDMELLLVEKPWLDVLQRLPPPLYRQRYGM